MFLWIVVTHVEPGETEIGELVEGQPLELPESGLQITRTGDVLSVVDGYDETLKVPMVTEWVRNANETAQITIRDAANEGWILVLCQTKEDAEATKKFLDDVSADMLDSPPDDEDDDDS